MKLYKTLSVLILNNLNLNKVTRGEQDGEIVFSVWGDGKLENG